MPKILITIDWFLPGTLSGGPVRSYANLIEHLKDDFEFYIITRNTDYSSDEPYQGIEPNTWVSFNHYTNIYYISESKLNKTHLREVINTVSFDVAYINGIYSWYFSILPILLLKKLKKPIIISARGMLNPQAFSVKGFKKKVFLKISKLVQLHRSVIFHATNTDEANYIKNIIGTKSKITVAPNLPRKLSNQNFIKKEKHMPIRFVNVARISVEKGTLKMLKALLNVKETIVLDLFGPIYDNDYWIKCQEIIKRLPTDVKVNYRGVIESEDVPNILTNYDFFVLLSEGENFGHAILEALAVGLPVLISKHTPWKGLEEKQLGWDVDINNSEAINRAILMAIGMDNNEYLKWSQASFNHAKAFIEDPRHIEQNKALFLNSI